MLPGQGLTLRELALEYKGDGKPVPFIDMLSKTRPLLEKLRWVQGNLDTGYRFTVNVGLPNIQYRSINEGIAPSRGTRRDHTETTSMLESTFEIDAKLMELSSDPQVYRMQQAEAHMSAFSNKIAEEIWYGNRLADPRGIIGLSQRYGDPTGPAAKYIISAGQASGATRLGSIWLIGHGDKSFHGIYPKNTQAGFKHYAGAMQDLDDGSGGGKTFRGFRDRFAWDFGIALPDYRQCVRICDIDMDKLNTYGTASDTSADILILMNIARTMIHDLNIVDAEFYMNRDMLLGWQNQMMKRMNINYTRESITDPQQMAFGTIPVKVDDSLLSAEEGVNV